MGLKLINSDKKRGTCTKLKSDQNGIEITGK